MAEDSLTSLLATYTALVESYQKEGIENQIEALRYNDILFTYHSTAIEGNTLTLAETTLLLEKDITAGGKLLKDHLEVKDHMNALSFVRQEATNKRLVTVDLVKETNKLVMQNTLADKREVPGEFRHQNVTAGKLIASDASQVPLLTVQFCEHTDRQLPEVDTPARIVSLAAEAHFNLVSIYPFHDGNGRTSRLLMNYLLFYFNLPLLPIYQEDASRYIEALNQSRAKQSVGIFTEFMVQQGIKFLQNEIEKSQNIRKGKNLYFTF